MSERLRQLEADLLKAIAHPTRIRILELLQHGERCVCELVDELELEQSNISQHLAVLKRQDVVSSRKDGLRVMYKANYPEIFQILSLVKKLLVDQAQTTMAMLENPKVKP